MKRFVIRDLTLAGGEAVLLDARHHRLQAVDQYGHRLGLLLEKPERLVALMRLRENTQRRGDPYVQLLYRLKPLTPAQGRKQPQHGRAGNAGDGGAEGETQALHRRRKGAADRLQIRRAFQCHAGAPQGRHHAQQRTEHAQQHQQANEVRCQSGCGQRDALTLHAQAHGVTQAGMQAIEPTTKAGRRGGQLRHGVPQRARGLAIAMQLERAREIAGADQQGDGRTQRVRSDVSHAHPEDGGETYDEDGGIDEVSEHDVPFIGCEALRAGLRPVENEHPVRRATRSACPCETRPAMRWVFPRVPPGRHRAAARSDDPIAPAR